MRERQMPVTLLLSDSCCGRSYRIFMSELGEDGALVFCLNEQRTKFWQLEGSKRTGVRAESCS